jgi:hypothetical protein
VVGVSLGQGTASASTSSASQIGRASFAGACAALVRLLQVRESECSAVETAFALLRLVICRKTTSRRRRERDSKAPAERVQLCSNAKHEPWADVCSSPCRSRSRSRRERPANSGRRKAVNSCADYLRLPSSTKPLLPARAARRVVDARLLRVALPLPLRPGPRLPLRTTCKIMSDATSTVNPSGSAPTEGGRRVAAQAAAAQSEPAADISDSELLKKKQKKNRSSLSKVKGRKGALKAFNALPLDLVLDICSYLDPADLYVLSNTSKVFRAVVTGPSSAQLWIDARARVGLPELELPMTDLQYAAHLFGRGCQFCKRKNAGKPEVYFRARICSACLKSQYVLRGLPLMRGPHSPGTDFPAASQLRITGNSQGSRRCPKDPPSRTRRHNPPCDLHEPAYPRRQACLSSSAPQARQGTPGRLPGGELYRVHLPRCYTGSSLRLARSRKPHHSVSEMGRAGVEAGERCAFCGESASCQISHCRHGTDHRYYCY